MVLTLHPVGSNIRPVPEVAREVAALPTLVPFLIIEYGNEVSVSQDITPNTKDSMYTSLSKTNGDFLK
jgi:hypothetical protein